MVFLSVLHSNVDEEDRPGFSTLCSHGAGVHGQQHPSSTPDDLGAVLRVSSSINHLQSGYARRRTLYEADGYIEGESRK